MALTSKQRAYLRGLASDLDPLFQLGKEGLNPHISQHFDEAIETRELIKGSVHKTSDVTPREAAETIAKAIRAEVVIVIGRRFVLYRPSKKQAEKGQGIILPRK